MGLTASGPPLLDEGLQLFACYAYPPNERGYCGSDDHGALLEYRAAGLSDRGLLDLARAFHGPWPYLKVLSERTGVGDPFDYRIVEAYWVGNALLDRVDVVDFGHAVEEQFAPRVGSRWRHMAEAIPGGGIPHHSFHVFVVYPYVGLLDSGRAEPLQILDHCRIRWGRVVSTEGETALVRSQPLEWDGRRLALGPPITETARLSRDGLGLVDPPEAGSWVSMHWDWVCDRLTPRQLANLRRFTLRQLDMTNRRLAHPGPAMVLG